MRRGDIHRFRISNGIGHEQHGERYGIIVQADELLPRSVVIVAPTSRSAKPASFRPDVEVNGEVSRVLVEQLGAVDTHRLGKKVGQLTASEMWAVDDALVTVLGLA